jgi:hypothetical protein
VTLHLYNKTRLGFGAAVLRRAMLLSALGLVGSAFACASDVFTAEPQAGGAGAAGEGGGGGLGEDGQAGGEQSGGGQAGAPPTTCDDSKRADPSRGLFVTVDGDDSSGDGSLEKPFGSLRRAVETAAEKGKSAIYVGAGAYEIAETIHIRYDSPVVELSGGWVGDCPNNKREGTILQGAMGAGATVLLEAKQEFRLANLTVKTKDKATPSSIDTSGNSLYGIRVRTAAKVSLSDVVVVAGHGGDGGFASKGLDAKEASSCQGVADCSTGADTEAGDDGTALALGAFDENGYYPPSGEKGGTGGVGRNGTPGKAGSSRSDCKVCNSDCGITSETVTAGQGACGCGGLGGEGGLGGRGGGASIALMVGAGSVDIKNSRFQTSLGGAGSVGGDGGLGADGDDGKNGGSPQCVTFAPGGSCFQSNPADICHFSNSVSTTTVPGGAAGGKGGRGGLGGRGGPGAGGPSYGIVTVGAASVEVGPGVTFDIGLGGQGASGTPNGDSAERKAF